ncbi:inositol phosphorylceramide synthase catalytic subunit Aur1p [Trichomonascus vanleenenianus]|uniref:inositol phosphorylceramide synthase n=1 Tax=Trichomonascus vanleenenianus TaxID=2268995 RepID=UPI003ECB41D0
MLWARRIQARFLQDATPGATIGRLESSWDVRITIERARKHQWSLWDLQYAIMVPSFLFCLCIIPEPAPIIRVLAVLVITLLCLVPITGQFFFRFLPIGNWLFFFSANRFIPPAWRPSIYVRVLPALETILYGGDLSDVLASFTHPALDILAWIPYGLVHYGAPFVVAAILFVFGPPKTVPVFAFAFGWVAWIAVFIQIVFPTAPPWYQRLNGLSPANYGMPGSPGGLERIDKILGLHLYSDAFGASPLVFGAFPSLHSGFAVLQVLFLSHIFPRYKPFLFGYIFWIWWSTMYLTHHYFVDLIGGAVLSFSMFYLCKLTILPRLQSDKFARWSYDYIETGVPQPSKLRKSFELSYDGSGADKEYEEIPMEDEETMVGVSAPVARTTSPAMYELPPIQTNFDSVREKPLDYYTHHKTSSYHLYDADLRSTSASSPNGIAAAASRSHPVSPTFSSKPRAGTPDSFVLRTMSPKSDEDRPKLA